MHGMVENFLYKQVTRPKGKVVFGSTLSEKRKIGRTARSRSANVDLSLKGSGRLKECTTQIRTHLPQ